LIFGTKEERSEVGQKIKEYLRDYYGKGWSEENLIYKKH